MAVVCHIYHADLSEEILKFIKNIRRAVDIFIATDTIGKADYIEKVFQGFDLGKVVVRIAENRGRDIATKLVTFRMFIIHMTSFFTYTPKRTTTE